MAAQRDALTAQLADATARIAELEDELTRTTLAGDDDALQEEIRAERDRLRLRVAEAESRVVELESELAATRAAWGSASQEQGSLSERVAELTAERDMLASDLARAEARQLYLQTDLERTRSELMQLKGIPPKLVLPESEPVATAPPALDTARPNQRRHPSSTRPTRSSPRFAPGPRPGRHSGWTTISPSTLPPSGPRTVRTAPLGSARGASG